MLARAVYGSLLTVGGEYEQAEALLLDAAQTTQALKGPGHSLGIRHRTEVLYQTWGQPRSRGTIAEE